MLARAQTKSAQALAFLVSCLDKCVNLFYWSHTCILRCLSCVLQFFTAPLADRVPSSLIGPDPISMEIWSLNIFGELGLSILVSLTYDISLRLHTQLY